MAAFSAFHRYVLPFIGSAVPIPAVDDSLLDAAIDFCERGRAVTETYTSLAIVGNTPTVDLAALAPTGLEVNEPLDVWSAYGLLTPKTEVELKALYPAGWTLESVADLLQVPYWIAPTKTTVRIVPFVTTDAPAALTVKAALKPTKAATTLPDGLYQNWARMIAFGALALLHSHKASYADPQRISGFSAVFEAGVRDAMDHYAHGFGKPILRTGTDEFV